MKAKKEGRLVMCEITKRRSEISTQTESLRKVYHANRTYVNGGISA